MKFLIIISLIALVVASPIDEKSSQKAPQKATSSYDNQDQKPVPLSSAPLSPSTAETHKLPKRETAKTQPSTSTNVQKVQPAVSSSVPAQKVDTSRITETRKTRDAPNQKAGQVVTPSSAQAPKYANQQKPQVQNPKREAPKPTEVKKTPVVNGQNLQPAVNSQNQQPSVARVPLTSTNSRSRRDAPKSLDQSKVVSSPAANVKADNTQGSSQTKSNNAPAASNVKPKRDTPAAEHHGQGGNSQSAVRRPAPVDQVLKQKAAAAATTEAPKQAVPQKF